MLGSELIIWFLLLFHLVNGQEYKEKKTLKLWKVTKNKNYAYLLEAIHKPMTELRLSIETNRTFNAAKTVFFEITSDQEDISDFRKVCLNVNPGIFGGHNCRWTWPWAKDQSQLRTNKCERPKTPSGWLHSSKKIQTALEKYYRKKGTFDSDPWFAKHWKRMRPSCLAFYLDVRNFILNNNPVQQDKLDDFLEKKARNEKKNVKNLESMISHFFQLEMPTDYGLYYLLNKLRYLKI